MLKFSTINRLRQFDEKKSTPPEQQNPAIDPDNLSVDNGMELESLKSARSHWKESAETLEQTM